MINELTYELSLHVLIILNSTGPASSNRIASYDFIATHGKIFKFSDCDLIESGYIKSQAYLGRMTLFDEAILYQIAKGNICPTFSQDGLEYALTKPGEDYIGKLDDMFCDNLQEMCNLISESYAKYSDSELSDLIERTIA